MQIERSLAESIQRVSQHFKVLLLTGPRQVGKTTLLQNLQEQGRHYLSLDDLDVRAAAKQDPAGFIDRLSLPVLIDEVQYAPELFPYIKIAVDQSSENGLFWLTGSQQFAMMKNVSESLAGRVGILNLQGISLAEELGRASEPPFLPTVELLKQRQENAETLSLQDVYFKIWRGSYPQVVLSQGEVWQHFYESYVTTYVERDVRDYLKVDDLILFRKFMQALAARSGQMLNFRALSRDIGISEPTVKSWFNILQATNLVFVLPPFSNNLNKRLLKTPKFYFMDTGLCCFLTRWLNPEVLESGAMAGAMLETYVVSEIVKSYIHNGINPALYYYADKERREVDLLIEQSGVLYPIEIKKSATIQNTNFKGFDHLESLKATIGHGAVLCFKSGLTPYNSAIDLVPIGLI